MTFVLPCHQSLSLRQPSSHSIPWFWLLQDESHWILSTPMVLVVILSELAQVRIPEWGFGLSCSKDINDVGLKVITKYKLSCLKASIINNAEYVIMHAYIWRRSWCTVFIPKRRKGWSTPFLINTFIKSLCKLNKLIAYISIMDSKKIDNFAVRCYLWKYAAHAQSGASRS
jgi:hypothetical protein